MVVPVAVGPRVLKWTWLLDNVELQGVVVADGPLDDGGNIGGADFNVAPDPNYAHLASLASGSGGLVHCETYRENVATHPDGYPQEPDRINRVEPWPIPTKPPSQVQMVLDPSTGTKRPLRPGDHIRLTGRWVIENGHPQMTHMRGWLNVGFVFIEFHPFDYTNLVLVVPPKPSDTVAETISIAAPIYEEVYLGDWWANKVAGVANHLFVTASDGGGTGGTIHNMVIANAYIKAPALPAPFLPHAELLELTETVHLNGTGLGLENIRTLQVVDDGIKVSVVDSAKTTNPVDGMVIADVNDPASNKSVFQARYTVAWRPRLTAPASVDAGNVLVGKAQHLEVQVANASPEPVTLTGWEGTGLEAFALTMPASGANVGVPPNGSVRLDGTFTPARAGTSRGTLRILSNDPAGRPPAVTLTGFGHEPVPAVELDPASLAFGTVGVGAEDWRTVTVRNTGEIVLYLVEVAKTAESHPDAFAVSPFISRQQLDPGEQEAISVAFTPKQAGRAAGEARVRLQVGSSFDELLKTVALAGDAVMPTLQLYPATLDFGAIPAGTSKTLRLLLQNVGDADLVVGGISVLSASRNAAFEADPAVAFPLAPIPPLQQAAIDVTFNAWNVAGTPDNATFEVHSNDPLHPAVPLVLVGAAAGGRITLSPDFIDFGHVATQASREATVANVGSSELTVAAVRLVGDRAFQLSGVPAVPFRIPAQQQQKLTLTFGTTGTGRFQTQLVVQSDDASHPNVSLNAVAERP
jgi:hypothetical protein